MEVCKQSLDELNTIEKQAELSSKKTDGTGREQNEFMMYHSDIEIGNNSILTRKGENEILYLSVHTFNKIITVNKEFIKETRNWTNNLIKKSNLISGISQKQRYQFFKAGKDKINQLYNKIENED